MSFAYRQFQQDDHPAFRDVVFQALHIPHDVWGPFTERIGTENLRTLTSGGRVVGGMGIYRTGLWFGGRCVPCGGVSIVGIGPEHRRRGAAKFLMDQSLRELREDGTPIAALYASTQQLYRAVGYEQAGSHCVYTLPLTRIGLQRRDPPLRQVSTDSPEPFEALYRRHAEATNGHLQRTPGLWTRILSREDHVHYGYLVGEKGSEQGYIIYYQSGSRDEPAKLTVREWCALTRAAAERLWTFVADHGSIAESVTWVGPANEPLLALPAEARYTSCHPMRWMVRILNVETALSARGYGDAEEVLHLDVRDDLFPENSGRFLLRVDGGRGDVERGGRGELICDIRGLAPLYSGLFSARTLRSIGWVTGDEAAVAAADRVFAGPEPWMPEIF